MDPELLKAIGETMSSPFWAAIALGIVIVLGFGWLTIRDKSIENRFSAQFDALIDLEQTRAAADIEVAKALSALIVTVDHTHNCVKRIAEALDDE